jgi:hypothetical protein
MNIANFINHRILKMGRRKKIATSANNQRCAHTPSRITNRTKLTMLTSAKPGASDAASEATAPGNESNDVGAVLVINEDATTAAVFIDSTLTMTLHWCGGDAIAKLIE